ncbi:MAG: hypothetical protein SFU98_22000 [Leptospiraceae bacterium]|nr:hypothetical protein [Leptospiraceae bacterium]
MSIRQILSETGKVKNTIYYALYDKLKDYEDEISDYDLRAIVFSMFEKILGYTIEWADRDLHGKNKILIRSEEDEAIIDISGLMESLKKVHTEYINKKFQ